MCMNVAKPSVDRINSKSALHAQFGINFLHTDRDLHLFDDVTTNRDPASKSFSPSLSGI